MIENILSKHGFDVQHFIEKFEDIDDSLWITDAFRRFNSEGVCVGRCAHGHCGCVNDEEDTEEGEALRFIFTTAFRVGATTVNDGEDIRFRQSDPRARVLAALYILRARGG